MKAAFCKRFVCNIWISVVVTLPLHRKRMHRGKYQGTLSLHDCKQQKQLSSEEEGHVWATKNHPHQCISKKLESALVLQIIPYHTLT